MYEIVRFFRGDHPTEILNPHATLEEAQEHCNDPETSSSTATGPEAQARTAKMGEWFDGYRRRTYDE